MHVFVSDVHMTDNSAGEPASDAELKELVDELAPWAEKEQVTLVLLGDIIDFLRSPKWDELWHKHKSAPWSTMAGDFANFEGGHAEQCVLEIQRRVTIATHSSRRRSRAW
jgi:UDP-2,3-diacylglucosamine pyrophosphatase LpxH